MRSLSPQERLRAISGGVVFAEKGPDWLAAFEHDLDQALAAERRATVERIRPYMPHRFGCGIEAGNPCGCGVDAILDAEADR